MSSDTAPFSGRLLVLMGSGETTPGMVTPHQKIVRSLQAARDTYTDSAVGDLKAVVLDSAYGFQENADELSAKTLDYLATNVGLEARIGTCRSDGEDTLISEAAASAVETSDWFFAGPGSPSYAQRVACAIGLDDVLRRRVRRAVAGEGRPSVTVLASAAACTAGVRTIPVYEIYKVGLSPHWLPGLDLTGPVFGRPVVVVPHFDNVEGGTHDTSHCYVGLRRMRAMHEDLHASADGEPGVALLGIDEHTALVLDLEAETATILGKGGVTGRLVDGTSVRHETGTTVAIADLLPDASTTEAAPADRAAADAARSQEHGKAVRMRESLDSVVSQFESAAEKQDWLEASAATLAVIDMLRTARVDATSSELAADAATQVERAARRMVVQLGQAAEAGAHDHGDLLRPAVDTLLELRSDAKQAKDFDTADKIRDALVDADVEVRDTRDGAEWTYRGANAT